MLLSWIFLFFTSHAIQVLALLQWNFANNISDLATILLLLGIVESSVGGILNREMINLLLNGVVRVCVRKLIVFNLHV